MRCHEGKASLNKITNFFTEKSLAGSNKVAMQFTQCYSVVAKVLKTEQLAENLHQDSPVLNNKRSEAECFAFMVCVG
jgi:hypothetical protein